VFEGVFNVIFVILPLLTNSFKLTLLVYVASFAVVSEHESKVYTINAFFVLVVVVGVLILETIIIAYL
jgi:hypothetical protein